MPARRGVDERRNAEAVKVKGTRRGLQSELPVESFEQSGEKFSCPNSGAKEIPNSARDFKPDRRTRDENAETFEAANSMDAHVMAVHVFVKGVRSRWRQAVFLWDRFESVMVAERDGIEARLVLEVFVQICELGVSAICVLHLDNGSLAMYQIHVGFYIRGTT